MIQLPDTEFESIISQALDELPKKYTDNLNNVAIVYADEPNATERESLKLRCDQTLYGLYQGIPLTARGAGYNLVLPDKITIYKLPLLQDSITLDHLLANVKHTLWHEIAHHFGLNHDRIHYLERKHQI